MSSFRDWVVIYLKGLAMGAADTVPGVSGGTIAFIMGIYERLIRALTNLDSGLLDYILRLHRRESWGELYRELVDRDFMFLIVLGLGILTAVVVVSRLMHAAIINYRPQTFAFFFGLIAASAVVLYRQLDIEGPREIFIGLLGFILAFILSGATATGLLPQSLPFVFLAGMVAISAMVLPGISGAFILLILGQYEYLTGVLSDFTDDLVSLATGGGTTGLIESSSVVLGFGAGALIGVFTVAHIVERMLENYRIATLTFLVSLMAGSLRLPIVEVLSGVGTWTTFSTASIVLPALAGGIAAFLLDWYTEELAYMDE